MTLASHRLLLDLMALKAEFSRVIMLNYFGTRQPPIPSSRTDGRTTQRRIAIAEYLRIMVWGLSVCEVAHLGSQAGSPCVKQAGVDI